MAPIAVVFTSWWPSPVTGSMCVASTSNSSPFSMRMALAMASRISPTVLVSSMSVLQFFVLVFQLVTRTDWLRVTSTIRALLLVELDVAQSHREHLLVRHARRDGARLERGG